jgi:hypothetical protein
MERASGCISSIARIFSYVLAGLLILSLPLSILANNTLRTFFSSDEVGGAIADLLLLRTGLREQLTDNIISDNWSDLGLSEGSRVIGNISPSDRVKVGQILFPEDWVRKQVRENIGTLMDWIESEEMFPELVLDLNPLWTNLSEGGSYRIAEIWIDSLPPCTREQDAQLDSALQQGASSRVDLCRPEGELRTRLLDFANQRLIQQVENLPREISLLDGMGSENSVNGLNDFRKNILGFLLLTRWMRLFPFLFLGLIMTFTIRSWQDLRKWWGIPLGLGSIFTIVILLVGSNVGPGIIKNAISQSAQPAELQESIVETVWSLVSSVLSRSAFQALFLLIIVGASFALPAIILRKGKQSVPKPDVSDRPRDRIDEIPPPPQVEPFQPETITTTPTNDQSAGNVE